MSGHSRLIGGQVKGGKIAISRESSEGEPEIVEMYLITFREPASGDMLQYAFDQETRDQLVADLTGGVYLGRDVTTL